MSIKYISIEEAAKRAGKDDFFRNVKSAVIPRLIEKGLLNGKTEKKNQLVADDDALAKAMATQAAGDSGRNHRLTKRKITLSA